MDYIKSPTSANHFASVGSVQAQSVFLMDSPRGMKAVEMIVMIRTITMTPVRIFWNRINDIQV
jgi:hypothetical protein